MNIITVAPAVPAGDGVGAWSDVSGMGKRKTVTVTGAFEGSLTIEVGNDDITGTNYCALHTFTGPGTKSFDVACEVMRCRFSGYVSGAPTVDIGGNDDGEEATALNMPVADGVGTGADLQLYGLFKTIICAGAWTGVVTIEISEDNVDYQAIYSFTKSFTLFTAEISARYMRVRRSGNSTGTPVVYCAAVKDDEKLTNVFGDGSDGDVTLVANIQLARSMYYRTLRTAGNDIDLNGYRLFCSELLYAQTAVGGPGATVIHANGLPGAGGTGGAGAAANEIGGGADGGDGSAGAAGGDGADVAGQSLGEDGGAGGAGNGGGNAGGAAGTVVALIPASETQPRAIPECLTGRTYSGGVDLLVYGGAGGGAGGGDAALTAGGGGGGGGGVALISAKTIRVDAGSSITARGGAGEAGGAADVGGGGGGGGGLVLLNYRTLINGGTINAAGGAAGASGGGTGAAGTAGTAGNVIYNAI